MLNKKDIIYNDDNFIAVSKPSGLLVVPDRQNSEENVKQILSVWFNQAIFPVHRIDKDTSGLIVFAKNSEAQSFLSGQFENREVRKEYLALVNGILPESKGIVNQKIGEHYNKLGVMQITAKGKEAITHYEVIEQFGNFSFLNINILTGRTHQIRVHMQFLGTPVVCDKIYGSEQPILLSNYKKKFKVSKSELDERPLLNRLALHSTSLSFKNLDGSTISLVSPLSKDIDVCIKQLKKYIK